MTSFHDASKNYELEFAQQLQDIPYTIFSVVQVPPFPKLFTDLIPKGRLCLVIGRHARDHSCSSPHRNSRWGSKYQHNFLILIFFFPLKNVLGQKDDLQCQVAEDNLWHAWLLRALHGGMPWPNLSKVHGKASWFCSHLQPNVRWSL